MTILANLAFQVLQVVTKVCSNWMGALGSILAILGVVAAPITSGDTVFRSARLIIADFIHLDQHPIAKRLYISVPLFLLPSCCSSTTWAMPTDSPKYGAILHGPIRRLRNFTLWAVTSYLVQAKKAYLVSLIPALFMTMASVFDIHFRSSRRLPVACDDLENHWRSRHARSLHLFPDLEEENRQRIALEMADKRIASIHNVRRQPLMVLPADFFHIGRLWFLLLTCDSQPPMAMLLFRYGVTILKNYLKID